MPDIIDFNAIPAAVRSEAKLNILAYVPNNEMTEDNPPVPKYTDLEWIKELGWRYYVTLNQRGHDIRMKQAAAAAIDIRNP